ncbi:MAG TPA: UxaA family hydrolase [Candidatus Methylomirabilis sp.]|nr:UxaA family hydrolase [Candidatus Methylomirabilis sp.]
MPAKRPYIILDEHDNVATAILDLQKGETIRTERGDIILTQAIAYGHKFALQALRKGDYIVKYGAQIGRATAAIATGEHVHVHNVEDIVDEVRKK